MKKESYNGSKKKSGPPSEHLAALENVTSFAEANEVAVVFFGDAEGEHASQFGDFKNVALANDKVSFGHTNDAAALTHYAVTAPAVVLLKKFDEGRNNFEAEWSVTNLKQFVADNHLPMVLPFDQDVAGIVFGSAQPGLFLYRDPNSENAKALEEVFAGVAKALRGKIKFVLTGIKSGLEPRLAEYIGITAADLPTVRIADTRGELKKYNLEGDITAESITQFYEDWNSGKLSQHLKSEDIPEKNDEPVKVLVGKNFNDLVINNTKDVFVKFYAPWCGHCKALAPKWDALAAKLLEKNPNLVIAKMDSTKNEVPGVQVNSFPTLKFWPGNNKTNPLDYSGERDEAGFIEYLKKNAKHDLVVDEEPAAEGETATDDKKDDL